MGRLSSGAARPKLCCRVARVVRAMPLRQLVGVGGLVRHGEDARVGGQALRQHPVELEGLGIPHRGGCLVKHQDARLPEDRMREGQALLLAAGQAQAPVRLLAQRHVLQRPQTCGPQRLPDRVIGILVRLLGIRHGAVEGARRHERLLRHEQHVELALVLAQLYGANRGPRRAQRPEEDTLPATVPTQQQDALAGLHDEVGVVPQQPATGQLHADVPGAEARRAIHRRGLPRHGDGLDLGRAYVHRLPEAPQPVRGSTRCGDLRVGVDKVVERVLDAPQRVQDLHQLAQGYLALEVVCGQDAERHDVVREVEEVAEEVQVLVEAHLLPSHSLDP
mmetsp:Transcript_290/g.846  ORF Transcript_290/g.846 Transcript_290/m.846 type:complete len:334 (-) Transcript_290:136-1137(-)